MTTSTTSANFTQQDMKTALDLFCQLPTNQVHALSIPELKALQHVIQIRIDIAVKGEKRIAGGLSACKYNP